jgi:hypothetical protein
LLATFGKRIGLIVHSYEQSVGFLSRAIEGPSAVVAKRRLREAGLAHGELHGPLHRLLVQVTADRPAGVRITAQAARREHVLEQGAHFRLAEDHREALRASCVWIPFQPWSLTVRPPDRNNNA